MQALHGRWRSRALATPLSSRGSTGPPCQPARRARGSWSAIARSSQPGASQVCGRPPTRPPSAQSRATPETPRGHGHGHLAARACTHRPSRTLPHTPSVHVPPLLHSAHRPLPRKVLTHRSHTLSQANQSSFCGQGGRGQPCQASQVASTSSTWMMHVVRACICRSTGTSRPTPPSPIPTSARSPHPLGPERAMSAMLDGSGCPLPCPICPAGFGIAWGSHGAGTAVISASWA